MTTRPRPTAAWLSLLAALSCAPMAGAAGIERCTVSAPGTMIFHTDLGNDLNSVTSFEVACTASQKGGSPVLTIALSPGSSGIEGQRTMRVGENVLLYDLYQDVERRIRWGSAPNTQVRELVLNSFRKTYTIYGRIKGGVPNVKARAGQYLDAPVIVTLSW